MANLTSNQIFKLAMRCIPQPESISRIEGAQIGVSIYWRGIQFNITPSLNVTESSLEVTTCHSLLMQALLRECAA